MDQVRRLFHRAVAGTIVAVILLVGLTGIAAAKDGQQVVKIEDKCDPTTFNAQLGPGACVGSGNVTVDQFLAEVQAKHKHGAWRFNPNDFHVNAGETILVRNDGGETHTFTKVQAFGGGLVQSLNDLSGNPVPAVECVGSNPDLRRVAAGTSFSLPTGSGSGQPQGFYRFQCCIHPWMRTTLTVRP